MQNALIRQYCIRLLQIQTQRLVHRGQAKSRSGRELGVRGWGKRFVLLNGSCLQIVSVFCRTQDNIGPEQMQLVRCFFLSGLCDSENLGSDLNFPFVRLHEHKKKSEKNPVILGATDDPVAHTQNRL